MTTAKKQGTEPPRWKRRLDFKTRHFQHSVTIGDYYITISRTRYFGKPLWKAEIKSEFPFRRAGNYTMDVTGPTLRSVKRYIEKRVPELASSGKIPLLLIIPHMNGQQLPAPL